MSRGAAVLSAALLFAEVVVACGQPSGLELRVVARGLQVPWSVVWAPDGWLWCTERPGRILHIHPETGEQRLLLRVPEVLSVSETGLMGLALHPGFPDTPWVMVAYTVRGGGGGIELQIVRLRYDPNEDTLQEPQVLLQGIPVGQIHAGCRLLALPDRTVLVTVGEGGVPQRSQDLGQLGGKILRIGWEGEIPTDNPLPGSPIWLWGVRNPQGLARSSSGLLYFSEHGASTDDELNLLERGRNYGWPAVEGYCDRPQEEQFCRDSNVVEPLYAWTPTVAPCGLAYYPPTGPLEEFRHALLLATLKGSTLFCLQLSPDGRSIVTVVPYALGVGRLRDVCVTPEGRVFVSTSNRDGRGTPREGDDKILELVRAQEVGAQEEPAFGWRAEAGTLRLWASSKGIFCLFDRRGGCVGCRSGVWETAFPGLAPGAYGVLFVGERVASRWIVVE